ncbi:hypothetical protein [Thermocrinis sp.]
MIRILLICIFLIAGSYSASLWIASYRLLPSEKRDIGILEGINIKVFGKEGIEWIIDGKKAKLENSTVLIEKAKFQSEDAVLLADIAFIDRISGEGFLEGNLKLYIKDATVLTERAEIRLKEGIAYGDRDIVIKDRTHTLEGKEWSLQIKPLRVIIKNAKTRLE